MTRIITAGTALLLAVAFNGCSKDDPTPGDATRVSPQTVTLDDSANSSGINSGFNGKSRSGFNSIYFKLDGYTLSGAQTRRLYQDITLIKSRSSGAKLRIEGNCDDFGTDEYNHALGLKRANAVRRVLLAEGIPRSKIVTVSNGESNPVCTDTSERCRARNRRADVNIVK